MTVSRRFTYGAAALMTLAASPTSTIRSSPRLKTKRPLEPIQLLASKDVSKSNKKPKVSKSPSPATRTTSFSATWAGSIDSMSAVQPHTLILGTHPSTTSFELNQYYAHPVNAFWWIAGDCLGFRRDTGTSPSTEKPYALAKDLQHDNIVPYEEQLRIFLEHGFCLWDVVASCERKGSLDQNIRNEVANPIREFCQANPSIRRIVLANGKSTAVLFIKYFKDWLSSGAFQAGEDEISQEMFGKIVSGGKLHSTRTTVPHMTIVSAMSVSPASAKVTYKQKRDFWKKHVYQPGLSHNRRTAVVTP